MDSLWKSILNQKYFIKYYMHKVDIYEINSESQTKIFHTFETETRITSIQFNPLVPNIIILSLINGMCKIYNILNKNDKEDILFENVNKEFIIFSTFNIFDPNIIATTNSNDTITIWDIRKLYYINILKTENEIIYNVKWSHYGNNYLEIGYEKNGENNIKLLDVINNEILSNQVVDKGIINFLYLKENILILIKKEQIDKINFKIEYEPKNVEKLYIKNIEYSSENLIKENNFLLIISCDTIYFIDI